jgi:hypothetical protein
VILRVAALCCALCVPALVGCSGSRGTGAGTVAAPSVAGTPARFARIDSLLARGVTAATRGDAAGVRALRGPVTSEGLALLKARLPHDLARADVPRFLSARTYFGEALKAYVAALEIADDTAAAGAIQDLYHATRGWIAAYQGLPAETSV